MYLSYSILIAFVAAISEAAPLQRDSTSLRTAAHLTSRVEIQQFLLQEARDQFMMFDSSRKVDNQDPAPLPLHLQTRHHARRRDADCSTYPPELQIFCFSLYGDGGGEDYYYSDTPTDTPPLKFDEVIGIDNLDSSQIGWTA